MRTSTPQVFLTSTLIFIHFNTPRVQMFRWLRFLRQHRRIALTRANRPASLARMAIAHSANRSKHLHSRCFGLEPCRLPLLRWLVANTRHSRVPRGRSIKARVMMAKRTKRATARKAKARTKVAKRAKTTKRQAAKRLVKTKPKRQKPNGKPRRPLLTSDPPIPIPPRHATGRDHTRSLGTYFF